MKRSFEKHQAGCYWIFKKLDGKYGPTLLLWMSFLMLTQPLFGSRPRIWRDTALEELQKGETRGVMITARGEIQLAPSFTRVSELNEAVIWDAWLEKKTLYVATGHDGRVYSLDLDTLKVQKIADLDESEAQSLAFWNGQLYIAANPGAVLYRWDPQKSELTVAWKSDERYIWDLQTWRGRLYIATGDQGKLYRIGEDGKPSMVLDTSDQNLVHLYSSGANLFIGAASIGSVYRLDERDKVTSVLPATRVEVGAMAGPLQTGGWELIVASIGNPVQPPSPGPPSVPSMIPPGQPSPQGESEDEIVVTAEILSEEASVLGNEVQQKTEQGEQPARPRQAQILPIGVPGGFKAGEIWAVDNSQHVIQLWKTQETWIYDLESYKDTVWIATGQPARILSMDKSRQISIQASFDEENVVRLIFKGTDLWALTGNPARIYRARLEEPTKGSFTSNIKDAGMVAFWGMFQWKGRTPAGSTIRCFTRTGNTKVPDVTWTDWQGPITGSANLELPPSRYFQYRCDLTGSWHDTPIMQDIRISFLPQNQPPRIQDVNVLAPGVVYREIPTGQEIRIAGSRKDVLNLSPPNSHGASPDQTPGVKSMSIPPPAGNIPGQEIYQWGMQTITWNAQDSDQDQLRYEVSIQSRDENTWRILQRDIKQPIFAWDTSTMPDGWYRVRIIASDDLSNPPGQGLQDERVSELFPIDHTPPNFLNVNARKGDGFINLSFIIRDELSPIVSVEYAIQPGEWEPLYPNDRILDSQSETFDVRIPLPTSGEWTIIQIRARDSGQNAAVISVK